MAYTLNTSHALYGNLIELIGVQSGALVSHKTARTFTKHADASYGTGTYGEHFRTVNGGYTAKGASFSPALVRDTYTNPNYSIVLVFNGRSTGSVNVGFLNNNGGTYTFSSPTWNSTGAAGIATAYTNSMVSGTTLPTGAFMVTTTRSEGAGNAKLYVGSTLAGTATPEAWNANTVVNYLGGYDGQGALGGDLVWAAIFDKVLSAAEIADLYNSLGASNAFGLVQSAAGTDAAAPGATLTGTSSLSAGSAMGGSVVNGTASGATLTGTSSLTAGAATGGSGATGSFTTDAMENNTGAGLLANTAVAWTWYQGSIGAAPTSTSHGTGTTNASGVLTVSGLPTGAGFLLVSTTDSSGVYYQPGTVT